MRENRPYGSEGGEGDTFPTPMRALARRAHASLMQRFKCRVGTAHAPPGTRGNGLGCAFAHPTEE